MLFKNALNDKNTKIDQKDLDRNCFFQDTFYLTYQGAGVAIYNITEVVPSTTVETTDTSTITTSTTSPTTTERISESNNVSLVVCFLGLIASQVILKLRRKEEIK